MYISDGQVANSSGLLHYKLRVMILVCLNVLLSIYLSSRIRVDGSFYIRADSPSQYANVFCHMTPIPGCGDGGWTLAMKIDGTKVFFACKHKYLAL